MKRNIFLAFLLVMVFAWSLLLVGEADINNDVDQQGSTEVTRDIKDFGSLVIDTDSNILGGNDILDNLDSSVNVVVTANNINSVSVGSLISLYINAPLVIETNNTLDNLEKITTNQILYLEDTNTDPQSGYEVNYDCKGKDICDLASESNKLLNLLKNDKSVEDKLKSVVDESSIRKFKEIKTNSKNRIPYGIVEKSRNPLDTSVSIINSNIISNEVSLVEDIRKSKKTIDNLNNSENYFLIGPNPGAYYQSVLKSVKKYGELPGGGYLISSFQDKQKIYVALYGSPTTSALGMLGEQDVEATIERVQKLTKDYEKVNPEIDFVPTVEIITTVASASPTDDNSYSAKLPLDQLLPLVDAAEKAGVYVLLDLQPGRSDFLTQAKLYESVLKKPHVGLALDPEWRLKDDQVHLRQIGSVDIKEVNQVSEWLAGITEKNNLPQKMFLLHQFKLMMITNREKIDTSHPELEIYIQMDGQGEQSTKVDTYNVLLEDKPDNVRFGWKNFFDEDTPTMLSPEKTLAIEPTPEFISYQ